MDFEILVDAARTGDRSGSTACIVLQLGLQLFCAHTGVFLRVASVYITPGSSRMTACPTNIAAGLYAESFQPLVPASEGKAALLSSK